MLGILNIIKSPIINLYNLFSNDLELLGYTGSIVHSLCISISMSFFIYTDNYEYFPLIQNISYSYLILDILLIYFVDVFSKIRNIYIIHHLLFLLSWNLYSYGPQIYCKLLLSEVSVIPLNLKYFSKRFNYGYEILLSFTTYFLFFIFRVLNFSYHTKILYVNGWYYLYPIFIPIASLQYYWFYLMTLKAYSFFNNKNKVE